MSSLPSSSLRRVHNQRSAPSRPPSAQRHYRVPTNVRVTPRPPSRCWNCADDKDVQWSLPIKRNLDGTFKGIGAFCSPECCRRYALDRLGSRGFEHCALVCEVVRKINGPRARVGIAPPFMSLDTFGGPLTREEYKRGSVCVVPNHVIVEYMHVVS